MSADEVIFADSYGWSAKWVVAALLTLVCVGLLSFKLREQPLEALAEMIATDGLPLTMPGNAARFFKIPDDSRSLREVTVRHVSGRFRSAQLVTQTGDIFFVEQPADNSRTYFFRTDRSGEPMVACYLDTDLELHPVEDFNVRFKKEKDFWLTYLREKTKAETK